MQDENNRSKPQPRRNLPGPPLSNGRQLECTLPDDLVVILTQKAFAKLFAYAYATDIEVSCLGIVERQGNTFRVIDLFLVAQESGPTHTLLSQEAVGQLIERLIAEGRKEDTGRIRCWCHSHPGNMGCFWSNTDQTTCRLLVTEWLVSIVVGSGFRLRCRIDVTTPVPMVIDHVPLCLDAVIDQSLSEECQREVAEKVRPTRFEPEPPLLTQEGATAQPQADKDARETATDDVDFCDLCGEWHGKAEKDCPLSGLPGYKQALAERRADRLLDDPFWDDLPLGGFVPE